MKKKNILLIMADQLRKDSLGCYGNRIVQTPNLDFLARAGIKFNRSYVVNPICMPNRLSIFTGMYSRNHSLWTNGLLLRQERRTIATELQQQGYQTASFGKIHFTPYGGPATHMESQQYWQQAGDDVDWYGPYWGFEHVELTIGHTLPLAHYGRWFREKGGNAEMLVRHPVEGAMESGIRKLPLELHDSSFVAERTIQFIKKGRDPSRPFFAVASFPDPHHPFDPPEEIANKYGFNSTAAPVGGPEDLASRPIHYSHHYRGAWTRKGLTDEKHPQGISKGHRNEMIAHTYAMVDLIDQQIGKILTALDEQGLKNETVIVFTSDHGELLGDHGLWLKGPFYYEGLINVPLLISAPGWIEPLESDALVSSVDLCPTLYDLMGLPIPHYVDGVSQKEHLFRPSIEARSQCLIEYRNGYGTADCSSKAIITKSMKYVRYQTGESELTDLEQDPLEQKNVAHVPAYKQKVQQMNELLLDEILSTECKWPEQLSHA